MISGITDSANFPVSGSGSAIDASCGPPCNSNNWDSYLTVVNSTTGAREVSTFVGGDDWEFPGRLARDRSAIAFSYLYQGGQSYSANFPPVNALQATRSGDADATFSIYRLEGNALERVLSTFIGGPGENEIAYGVDVDQSTSPKFSMDHQKFPTQTRRTRQMKGLES